MMASSVPRVLRHVVSIFAFSLLVAAVACGPNAPTGGDGVCWLPGRCNNTLTDPASPEADGPTRPMKPSQDPQIASTACSWAPCGNIVWGVRFTLPAPAATSGWVVQEVAVTRNITGPGGGGAGGADGISGAGGADGFIPASTCFHDWEAFYVAAGASALGGLYGLSDDTYVDATHMPNTSGTVAVMGKAKFYEGTLPADFVHCNPATVAMQVRSTPNKPDFWDGTGTEHDLAITWDCTSGKTTNDLQTVPAVNDCTKPQ